MTGHPLAWADYRQCVEEREYWLRYHCGRQGRGADLVATENPEPILAVEPTQDPASDGLLRAQGGRR